MNHTIHIVKVDKTNRDQEPYAGYLQQYYAVRAKTFSEQLGSAQYKNEASEHDLDQDTVSLLAVTDSDTVVGGCQLLVSKPASRRRLRFESSLEHLKIENLLPHCETKNLTYGEMGGVAVDSSASGLLIALKLQKHMVHMIHNHEIPIDVIIGRVTPKNVSILLKAVRDENIPVVVRDDVKVEIDGLPRVIMMYAANADFPLLSEKMKADGVGVPGDEFLFQHLHRQKPLEKA